MGDGIQAELVEHHGLAATGESGDQPQVMLAEPDIVLIELLKAGAEPAAVVFFGVEEGVQLIFKLDHRSELLGSLPLGIFVCGLQ